MGHEYASVGVGPSENAGHVANLKVRPTEAGGVMVYQVKSLGQGVGWLVRSKRKPHHALIPGGVSTRDGMAGKQNSRGCGGTPPRFFLSRVSRSQAPLGNEPVPEAPASGDFVGCFVYP